MDPELLKRLAADVKRAAEMGLAPADIDAYIQEETGGAVKNVAELFRIQLTGEQNPPGKASLVRPLAQGAFLDFGDELAGVGAALVPGGRGYREARDDFRAETARTRSAYPGASIAAEVAGGFAVPALGTAGALARGAKGAAGLLRAGAVGAGLGAATGAVAGAGGAPEMSDVPAGAAEGAAGGAMVGGALGVVLRPAAAALGGLAKLAQDVLSPDAAVARRTRDLALKAMTDAGHTPEQAMAALRELERVAPGQAILADVSPRLGRELRTSVNAAPALENQVQEFLAQRQGGMSGRLAEGLEDAIGVTGAGAREARVQAKASMPSLGNRLYGPLDNGPSVSSPEIGQILSDPDVMRTAFGQRPTSEGMSFGRLQRTVQDLIDQKSAAFRAGRGHEGNRAGEHAAKLTQAIEDVVPGYRAANAQYARGAAVTKAFGQGAKAMEMRASDVREEVQKLMRQGGQEAVDAYRMGFIEQLSTKLRSTTRNRNTSTRLAEMGEDTEKVFRILFPDESSYRAFMERARAERQMQATRTAARWNSTTTQQAMDAQSSAAADIIQGARTGGVGGAAAAGAARSGRALVGDVNERSREQLGRMLMRGPKEPELEAFIKELQRSGSFNLLGRVAAQTGLPMMGGGLYNFGE